MALNFANVTDVRIPQGDCIRIQETVGGRILWEKKKGKYEIRKNGVTVDWVDIDQLQRKITDGTAQSQYGIGAQLILTIKNEDTVNNKIYEIEYPMNFGTFRTFTKENGQTVNGLGLHAAKQFPHFAAFDLPRTGSSTEVTCRWKDSLIREWMNNEGSMPAPRPAGDWTTHGMAWAFPSDFLAALCSVKVQTSAQSGANNFVVDTVYDKFFLLSIEEISSYINPSKNPAVYIPAAGTEGTAWEYWEQRLGGSVAHDVEDSNRRMSDHTAWLRSQYKYRGGYSVDQRYMYGYNVGISGYIVGAVNVGVSYDAVVPACVLPGI